MTTREITGRNYTATCAELICAFASAIEAERKDRGDKDVAASGALELAASCGWQWESDQGFTDWTSRATAEEILVEALQRVLAAVRAELEVLLASGGC